MIRDDVMLQQDVLEELDWEPSINAADIGVTVKNGVVTIGGTVHSYAEKYEAENAVLRLKGVKGVANDLDVELHAAHRRDDGDIAAAALDALKWNVFLPSEKVKVKVDDGWITLQGEVEWQYQRERAEKAVRSLVGVRGVTNLLKVKSRVTPTEVREKIRKALNRIAMQDLERVTVAVDGRKVTLGGFVSSVAERNAARRAAWAAPGVDEVVDNVHIRPLEYA